MDVSQEPIDALTKNIDRYEQEARRRAWLSAIIPSIFGVLLLAYTVWQIQIYGKELANVQQKLNTTNQQLTTANGTLQETSTQLEQTKAELASIQGKLDSTTAELEHTRQELEKTKQELEEVTNELRNANVFIANSVSIDAADEKSTLNEYYYQPEVLFYIQGLERSGVGWNRNGFSEAEGFNSPNFALYVLQHFDLVSADYKPGVPPWQILKPEAQLKVGDIIYYKGGYAMFYFEVNELKFVIGMTPVGIVAQKPDFAPILGYLCVPYPGVTC